MKLKIIGYTDSINECDCCGKTELKGTFVMADEFNNELYYGKICGAKAAGWSIQDFNENVKTLKSEEKKQKAVNEMIIEAGENKYKQQNLLKFIRKNDINLNKFLIKNGTELIGYGTDNTVVYKYGNECIIINK